MLGVVVLIVAVIALRSPRDSSTAAGTDTRSVSEPAPTSTARSTSSSAPRTSSPRSSSTSSSSQPVRRGALPLIVLNDSGTAGLADEAKRQFMSGGWKVTDTDDNYENNILSTAAYYDPAVRNAKAVAELLQQQFPAIKRVVAKFEGLPDGPIVVVLTAGYSTE